MISASRASVSRAMKELREKGAVEVVRRRVHLGSGKFWSVKQRLDL